MSFIPSFHLKYTSEEKMTDAWYKEAVNHCYFQSNNVNLLHGKNVKEINSYAVGDYSMKPFKDLFSSKGKQYDDKGEIPDLTDMVYQPLPLLAPKLNSAEGIISKIPVEISVKAQDATAFKKKNSDISFLKNKPKFQAVADDMAAQLGLEPVDLGSTKNGAVNYNNAPYGLVLTEPDEEVIFSELIYSLSAEAAYEIIMQHLWDTKNGDDLKLLGIRDQMKYGVSCFSTSISDVTGLPNFEYCFPGSIELPKSHYPDFRDSPHRFEWDSITVLELFERFGGEICDEDKLEEIINGYCKSNGCENQSRANWDTYKINVLKCEIRSVDWVGIKPVNPKSKFSTFVTGEKSKDCKDKIWAQNTYQAYWLFNTAYFFGKSKLPYSFRTEGKEYLQGFSSVIYKSQDKSLVELAIPENKKAQIADIKLLHAMYKAVPSGKYIDIASIRAAYNGLIEEGGSVKYVLNDLIDLATRENIMIGDTTEWDGNDKGQMLPSRPIPGGFDLREIEGYLRVIANANAKIAQYTGINEQLTGMAANPEGLVGMQELMINSAINQLRYVNVSIERQVKDVIAIWAESIKYIIKKGGAAKKAIENIISNQKLALLESVSEIPLHQMGVYVTIGMREEEDMRFERGLERMEQAGVLNLVDEFILSGITNPREKRGFLAARYKQFERRQDVIRSQQNQQQQILVKQKGDNDLRRVKMESDADVRKVAAQEESSKNILKLATQLGMTDKQLDAFLKKQLQQERGEDQLKKNIATLDKKYDLERQQP